MTDGMPHGRTCSAQNVWHAECIYTRSDTEKQAAAASAWRGTSASTLCSRWYAAVCRRMMAILRSSRVTRARSTLCKSRQNRRLTFAGSWCLDSLGGCLDLGQSCWPYRCWPSRCSSSCHRGASGHSEHSRRACSTHCGTFRSRRGSAAATRAAAASFRTRREHTHWEAPRGPAAATGMARRRMPPRKAPPTRTARLVALPAWRPQDGEKDGGRPPACLRAT